MTQLVRTSSFEEFAERVAGKFALDIRKLTPDSLLAEDLGLDSIQMYMLWAALAEWRVEVPETAVRSVRTTGQLFDMVRKYGRDL